MMYHPPGRWTAGVRPGSPDPLPAAAAVPVQERVLPARAGSAGWSLHPAAAAARHRAVLSLLFCSAWV